LRRLQLLQERRDLEVELETKAGARTDPETLEGDFAKVAQAYGERKGDHLPDVAGDGGLGRGTGPAGITRGS